MFHEKENHHSFKCTHPKFIPIRTKLFEAIFELANRNIYESTQDPLLKLLSFRQSTSKLLETFNDIVPSQ